MKFGDKGKDVRRIQEALLARGYPLPRFGSDGDLGDETWTALKRYAGDNGHALTGGKVPVEVLDELLDEPTPVEVPAVPPPLFDTVKLYDLRGEQTDPPAMAKKFKRDRHGKVIRRDPAEVTGITVHQTAVRYQAADYQIAAAGGDRELALARRALRVACHVMAFHDGFVVATNPLDWYVYHGNAFNSFELGIEIDGNYPGLIGGTTWNGKTPTEVSDEVVRAACAGIEYLVREGRAMGMPITQIHAHRQSSSTRRSDPGEELWKRVVLDFAVPKLGLETEPERVLGNGRPIPTDWDPSGVGAY